MSHLCVWAVYIFWMYGSVSFFLWEPHLIQSMEWCWVLFSILLSCLSCSIMCHFLHNPETHSNSALVMEYLIFSSFFKGSSSLDWSYFSQMIINLFLSSSLMWRFIVIPFSQIEWFTVKGRYNETIIKVSLNMWGYKKLKVCLFQGQEVRLLWVTSYWPVYLISSHRVGWEIHGMAEKDSNGPGLISTAFRKEST